MITLISQGIPSLGIVKQGWGRETCYFQAKCVNTCISKTIKGAVNFNTNTKSHMRFRLAPRFAGFRRFRRQQLLSEWR